MYDNFAISPDGRHIVIGRLNYPQAARYQILTISSDGSDEHILQTGSTNEQPDSFAWAPKGDEFYYAYYSREEGINAIDVFDLFAGKAHRFLSFADQYVGPLYWLPDRKALLVSLGGQIGFIRGTGRDVEPITRDANAYGDTTITADRRAIAAVQGRDRAVVSVLSRIGREFNGPREILSQPNNDGSSLAWSADGDLLIVSGTRVVKMKTDGTHQGSVLADTGRAIWLAASCGANYLVLYGGFHSGSNFLSLWRVNSDGSHPVELTHGKMDAYPVCSPDRTWVYYYDALIQRIFRVRLDGSSKVESMFDVPTGYYFSGGLTISADGKTLAAPVAGPTTGVSVALYEIGSSRPARVLDADIYSGGDSNLQSTHEGNSVAYVKRRNGVDNLWVNRLDGSAAYPITDYKSDRIWGFSFSPDRKCLAVLQVHTESDVVLLQETIPDR
jgi:Tol biopolymer transport system component